MTVRRKRRAAASSRDPMERFHDEWLGMVQPIDGLVVSKPALIEAQVARPDDRTLRDRYLAHLTTADPAHAAIASLPGFCADLLGLGPDRWLEADALGDGFRLAIPDTGQLLSPTRALVRDPASPPVALLWELPAGLPLDQRETVTGGWDYPPSAKFDRLLRHAGVAIGLLSNGTHLRLLYAPHGASTGALTFPVGAMATTAGRPILDALVMLLHATRWFGVAEAHQLPALLAASREAQGRVTKALADQVLEALHLLLAGFEQAHTADGDSALAAAYRDPDLGADHVYAGLLTCMLRLVFVLYAEDNDLLPVDDDFYAENLSALALYEDLAADAGAYPDAMARRFGAYGRLLSLFRAIYFGVSHGGLRMPPRHGELFSPHVYRFLEGNREPAAPGPGDPDGRRRLDVPAIDDETVYLVLRRLLVLGDERLSYKALDVEQIGSVYENLMGFRVVELTAESVCLKKSRAWISGDDLGAEPQGARGKWLQREAGLAKADADRAARATAGHKKPAAILDALIESGVADSHSRTPAGRFVIQPGAERRRSGSHYTPRSLTAPIVEKTLAPLLAALPRTRKGPKGKAPAEGPSSEDLLSLKICDPAMGSGAFLVEVVRQLGDHVVAAWRREGQAGALLPAHGPAHDVEDAVAQARRLVAQRCIYGVDKNPQAVTLAKLSLWLVTLAKDKPFSFLDHALRCGDSLVGLDIDQITAFHWDAGKKGQQLDLIDREIRDVLTEAVFARERIVALARDDSPAAQREKERLLADAQDAVGRLRLIGDLVLGAFFSSTKDKEREAERVRRRDLVERWLGSGRAAPLELVELAAEFRGRIPAFHWMIELPEVFWVERPDPLDAGKRGGAAWIDGMVGNPPFLGGRRILGGVGEQYGLWLEYLHRASKNADLVAHFFRRAAHLIGDHGTMGLIATNTISQGDTRATGLQAIVADGGVIYDATRTMPWPGEAAVAVAVVHLLRGSCDAAFLQRTLDGVCVRTISSRLRAGHERADPVALAANASLSYQGSVVVGMGFVLSPEERDALVAKDARNDERIFPYLGGEEVNTSPTQDFDRYVINFGDMSLDEAGRWPDLLAIIRERVKPERDRVSREAHRKYWWHFGDKRPALYAALVRLDRFLATSYIAKHRAFAWLPSDIVISHNVGAFCFHEDGRFAAMQSRVHIGWAALLSSSLEDRSGYRPSDCFETFPFPPDAALASLDAIGRELYDARARYMVDTNQGLTATYNQLKDPTCADEPQDRIRELRRLHEDLDRGVLAAYGWSDIAVPPYCPATDAERAAVALFEDTVIDRLFALNAERAAEEAAAAGLPAATRSARGTRTATPKKKGGRKAANQTSLLDED
ncbi:MAG: hypothetical protein KC464_21395 [Myxococcales bacterium]|nr:hypothetical protein [Myxococcales bacterium]